MIKVIEGYKLKPGTDIQPIFLKLWSNAMQQPGFIGAENMVGEKDIFIVVFVSTWSTVDNWKLWEKSRMRMELYWEAEKLSVEEPKVNIYRIVPTHW
jgi:heme-degrading monooxygenase HmoA